MTRISKARRALALLEARGIESIEALEVTINRYSISISASPDKLTEEEVRILKRMFGPLKVSDTYAGKDLVGTYKVDDEFEIRFRLASAYACKKLDPEKITDEKWQDIQSKVREGLIKIEDCNPVEVGSGIEAEA